MMMEESIFIADKSNIAATTAMQASMQAPYM